jgi:Up-regulated During Septation
MAMHLLVETAIIDSQEYEVLSFEEVDELKKEYTILSNRIEASKRKLALESKVRDAALSLSRLYSKKGGRSEGSESGAHRHRRSFLSGRGSGSELVNKTDEELVASNRKCEELAQELWRLSNRATEIQKRLLQHTSGILQMTHSGNSKRHPTGAIMQHRVPPPGSPESMYTSPSGRRLSPPIEVDNEFDDRSLYRTPDNLDGVGAGFGGGNAAADGRTRSKSPARSASRNSDASQHTQVAIVSEKRLEDLNDRLRELIIQSGLENKTYEQPPRYQANAILPWPGAGLEAQLNYLERGLKTMTQHGSAGKRLQDQEYVMEERLEELNIQLCNMVIIANPQQALEPPPRPQSTGANVQGQLEYLENGLAIVERQLQGSTQNAAKSAGHQEKVEQYEAVLTGLWEIILSGEDEARQRKLKKRQELAENPDLENDSADLSPDEDPPLNEEFSLQVFSAKVQRLYSRATSLKEQKNILHRQIKQQRELNNKSDAEKDAEIAESRNRLAELTEEFNRTRQMLREAEMEASNAHEQLTVVMERLDNARRESTLREQQKSNEEAAALKAEREARRETEENMLSQIRQKQEAIVRLEGELEEITDDLRIARAELQGKAKDSEAKIKSLEEELAVAVRARKELETKQASLEAKIKKLEEEMALASNAKNEVEIKQESLEAQIKKLGEDLALAVNAKNEVEMKQASLQAQIEEKIGLAESLEKEARRLEGEVVRLQTELTVSRAELDGAYGTRAQRAAEVAANPVIQKELEDMANRNALLLEEVNKLKAEKDLAGEGKAELNSRMQMLQRELLETIAEYEAMTKQNIEAEKERDQLESQIDSLKDTIENLENQLSDEKVRGLGLKGLGVTGAGAPGGESTSTMVLKNEFKKMIRDTRAEGTKLLKVSPSSIVTGS